MCLYYIFHAVSVILVYFDLLPERLTGKKYFFALQNFPNYVVTAVMPVHSYGRTFILMTPIFLFAVYAQTQYDQNLQDRVYAYLPPDLQDEFRADSSGMVSNILYKHWTVTMSVLFSQYLQNIETARLVIEKFVTEKQHQQLN